MTALFARPTYYLEALGLPADFDAVTADDVKKAYGAMASNGEHPDHNGDPERWKLITAAYNELKAIYGKKRGRYENQTDEAWLRHWNDLNAPATTPEPEPTPKPEAPKAKKPKAKRPNTSGFVFEEKDGESKEDRRKRYARSYCKFRYDSDPEYAAKRKTQSGVSHKKSREAKKATASAE